MNRYCLIALLSIINLFGADVVCAKPLLSAKLRSRLAQKATGPIRVLLKFHKPSGRCTTKDLRKSTRHSIESLKINCRILRELWICQACLIETQTSQLRLLEDSDDITHIVLPGIKHRPSPLLQAVRDKREVDCTYGLSMMNVPRVWQELGLTGEGVTVGILDSGWANHPELKGRVLKSRDFIDGAPDDTPADEYDHGTHCMGTIGGSSASGKAIGVAPSVTFIVGKIFSKDNEATDDLILEAMQWMADPDGNPLTNDQPRIVSNSWGDAPQDAALEALYKEAINTWTELGMVSVFAAGNDGKPGTVNSPGGHEGAISVGSVTSKEKLSFFSSQGPFKFDGREYEKPDLCAPGSSVYSLSPDGGYGYKSGTSMATPHVAGVVALMLQANPEITIKRVKEILKTSCKNLGKPGYDLSFGHGRLDAFTAVAKAQKEGNLRLDFTFSGPSTKPWIELSPGQIIATISETGPLMATIPADNYSFTVNAFGYVPIEVKDVVIEAGKTSRLSLALKKAKLVDNEFTVFDETGEALAATISFFNSELSAELAPLATKLKLPMGYHIVDVTCHGFEPLRTKIEVQAPASHSFSLKSLPSIFLVDDDEGKDYEKIFAKSLNSLGATFIETKDNARIDEIRWFKTVIWISGDSSYLSLNKSELETLIEYVENGGNLLLTGQDIGLGAGRYDEYILLTGAKLIKDNAQSMTVKGLGETFTLGDNQKWPDLLAPVGQMAKQLFEYDSGGCAAIENSLGKGRVRYLGFGFEGVQGEEERRRLMERLLGPSSEDELLLRRK